MSARGGVQIADELAKAAGEQKLFVGTCMHLRPVKGGETRAVRTYGRIYRWDSRSEACKARLRRDGEQTVTPVR